MFIKIKVDSKPCFSKTYISKPGHLQIHLMITTEGMSKWEKALKSEFCSNIDDYAVMCADSLGC